MVGIVVIDAPATLYQNMCMLIFQTNPATPIWRDPNFILAVTTLVTVAGKWISDLRTAKAHDRKLDTISDNTNGVNTRLSNQNDALTATTITQAATIKEQAKVISGSK